MVNPIIDFDLLGDRNRDDNMPNSILGAAGAEHTWPGTPQTSAHMSRATDTESTAVTPSID